MKLVNHLMFFFDELIFWKSIWPQTFGFVPLFVILLFLPAHSIGSPLVFKERRSGHCQLPCCKNNILRNTIIIIRNDRFMMMSLLRCRHCHHCHHHHRHDHRCHNRIMVYSTLQNDKHPTKQQLQDHE